MNFIVGKKEEVCRTLPPVVTLSKREYNTNEATATRESSLVFFNLLVVAKTIYRLACEYSRIPSLLVARRFAGGTFSREETALFAGYLATRNLITQAQWKKKRRLFFLSLQHTTHHLHLPFIRFTSSEQTNTCLY